MNRKTLLASLTVCLLVGSSLSAAVNVTLAPPFIEKLVRPGTKLNDTIVYTNNSDEAMEVSVDFADFTVNEKGEVAEMPSGTDATTLARYLRISPMKIQVEPGGRAMFRYSLAAPAEFNHLRTQIFFSSKPIVEDKPNQVLFIARMGIPLYLESTSAKAPSIKVHEVKWERSSDDPSILNLHLLVTNEGERIIRPTGYLQVRSSDGNFSKNFNFNEGNEPVLPGQKRNWRLGFGPVPGGDLSLDLRFATSPRTMFEEKYQIP
jgi:hypothetical protein